MLVALTVMVLGALLLRLGLKRMNRQHRMRTGLADALDLMVICTDAGLPLDKTITQVSKDLRHVHPDLSEELYLASLEMRAGTPWDEALCNLSNERVWTRCQSIMGFNIAVYLGPTSNNPYLTRNLTSHK